MPAWGSLTGGTGSHSSLYVLWAGGGGGGGLRGSCALLYINHGGSLLNYNYVFMKVSCHFFFFFLFFSSTMAANYLYIL